MLNRKSTTKSVFTPKKKSEKMCSETIDICPRVHYIYIRRVRKSDFPPKTGIWQRQNSQRNGKKGKKRGSRWTTQRKRN